MQTPENPEKIELQAKLFRGFGDPVRLSMLSALQAGPLTVSEIVAATGVSQPNASNHLRCLRECGLVSAEQKGKNVLYRLSDKRVSALLFLADALLQDIAQGIYECTRYDLPHRVGQEKG